jgi:hypothetical protein
MIRAVLECCAGIDVGKKIVVACVMTGPADGEAREETRKYGCWSSKSDPGLEPTAWGGRRRYD